MEWKKAPDIQKEVLKIVIALKLSHVVPVRIFCFRSFGSKSRALARIWSLPRIWQDALETSPAYCLEILSEKFDKLSLNRQREVLIHELLHIPSNFSGSLLSHRNIKGMRFEQRVKQLFSKLR